MDTRLFEIHFDENSKFLNVTCSGFWSLQTVDDFSSLWRAAIARIRQRGLKVGIVVDAASMKAQSQEIGDRFVATWQSLFIEPDDYAAIIAGSALAAMQFRRIYETDHCHVFASRSEAEAWLVERRGA